jgi:hypothetical protein
MSIHEMPSSFPVQSAMQLFRDAEWVPGGWDAS